MSGATQGEVCIAGEGDIVTVRKTVREAAVHLGFGLTDVTRIVTAASELARNVFHYADAGVMRWRVLEERGRTGLELVFADQGPGIPDIAQALREGYSTAKGMGMGLPGAQRLMDDFDIVSAIGRGTTVTVRKRRKT
jgi:serine/threonine-protein kinase RsbT